MDDQWVDGSNEYTQIPYFILRSYFRSYSAQRYECDGIIALYFYYFYHHHRCFVLRGSWFVVRGSFFVVRSSWFIVYSLWFVVYSS